MLRFKALPYKNIDLSAAMFEPLHHLPMAIFLDSSQARHVDKSHYSRFDIISAYPSKTLTLKLDSSSESEGEQGNGSESKSIEASSIEATVNTIEPSLKTKKHSITVQHGNGSSEILLSELQSWLDSHSDQSIDIPEALDHLPFFGGLLGYWGYSINQLLDDIDSYPVDDIELPSMCVGLYDWALIRDHQLQQSFLIEFSPIRTDDLARPSFEQLEALFEVSLQQGLLVSDDFELTSTWQANMDQATYVNKFNQVKDFIHAGDCYQINLAQRFQASYSGNSWHAYQRLAQANKAPFSAYINLGSHQILSISPERFLQVDGKNVVTEPIKGTQPRSENPSQDAVNKNKLFNSEKDRAENLMIVDLMRNDLGKSATPGSVRVPELFEIKSFSAVHHLVSKVTATLKPGISSIDCLLSAFPGGSITGAPKHRAMQIIRELEPNQRHVYCGSIGYIDYRQTMDTSIAIRTLITVESSIESSDAQNGIYCWAGGGLVADSEAASEYQECFDKLNKILPILTFTT
jgi:para-aminobenzoate synthetase component I